MDPYVEVKMERDDGDASLLMGLVLGIVVGAAAALILPFGRGEAGIGDASSGGTTVEDRIERLEARAQVLVREAREKGDDDAVRDADAARRKAEELRERVEGAETTGS